MVMTLAFGYTVFSVMAQEPAPAHWVGTWESSPQPIWGPDFIAL